MSTFFEKLKEIRLVKRIVFAIVGAFSYTGINLVNKLQINGMENLHKLPKQRVLFVSNHQTYFADVITFIHIFCAVRFGRKKTLGIPFYLLWPYTNITYVAAEETMMSNWMSKLFTLGGAITVKRTWKGDGQEVRNNLDPSDTRNIERSLKENWVITFPQGTTQSFAPGRKGTAFIIKHYRPIVVPVVINGYCTAFNKKGLKLKKKGSILSVKFKDPMVIDYDDTTENILEKVMDAIEQSKKFMKSDAIPLIKS